jgi:hypothetical protein
MTDDIKKEEKKLKLQQQKSQLPVILFKFLKQSTKVGRLPWKT